VGVSAAVPTCVGMVPAEVGGEIVPAQMAEGFDLRQRAVVMTSRSRSNCRAHVIGRGSAGISVRMAQMLA
jgi:hypothetical protein